MGREGKGQKMVEGQERAKKTSIGSKGEEKGYRGGSERGRKDMERSKSQCVWGRENRRWSE